MRKRIIKWGLIVVVLLALGAFAGYRVFFLRMVRVPTGAMANTIIPGDHLIVRRTFGEVKRGDIIVFKWPKDPSVEYVSRVVGLPGETIEVRNRSVYIGGRAIPEQRVMVKPDDSPESEVLEELSSEGSGPYRVFYVSREEAKELMPSEPGTFGIETAFRIPDNQYFVMGDNRDNSYDSRMWGTVPRGLIWGKPTVIYWSSSHNNRGNEEKIRWERIGTRVR